MSFTYAYIDQKEVVDVSEDFYIHENKDITKELYLFKLDK